MGKQIRGCDFEAKYSKVFLVSRFKAPLLLRREAHTVCNNPIVSRAYHLKGLKRFAGSLAGYGYSHVADDTLLPTYACRSWTTLSLWDCSRACIGRLQGLRVSQVGCNQWHINRKKGS